MLQLSFNKADSLESGSRSRRPQSLAELERGDEAELASIDLPDGEAQRLMELGFLPGSKVMAAAAAPGGDPRVFRVDGSEVALRRETAAHIRLK